MRKTNDFYPTDERLTKCLLDRVDIDRLSPVFEPCAGDGAIIRCLRENGFVTVDGNDIDPQFEWDYEPSDAATKDLWASLSKRPDWVITNPPFNQANLILSLAFECSIRGVAFLLRLSYLEPANNRGKWLRSHSKYLSNLIIFGQPRPSYTGNNKTDSCTTAWMVWKKHNPSGKCDVDFVFDWKS